MIRVDVAYGRQESYIPYEVRPTCQMCDSPAPLWADLTVGTIGIASQGDLLMIARHEETDALLELGLLYGRDGHRNGRFPAVR